jgi:hypothetical protein
MPAGGVRIEYSSGGIRNLMAAPNGGIVVYMHRQGEKVRNAARRNAPVDTGRLRGSITSEMRRDGNRVTVRIGSNLPYAVYTEEGTGIYAGRGMIRPRRAKFLAWQGRGAGGGWIFARAVRGQPGQHWLRRALDAAGG